MADRVVYDLATGTPRRYRDLNGQSWVPEVYLTNPSVAVTTSTPTAANIVGGRGAASGAEILRVPAGRTWRGEVHLTGQAANAIGAAAAVHTADIVLAGAGATPAAGTVLSVALALPATTATATQGTYGRDAVSMPFVIVAGGADAVLTVSASAGMTAVRASARGELIA